MQHNRQNACVLSGDANNTARCIFLCRSSEEAILLRDLAKLDVVVVSVELNVLRSADVPCVLVVHYISASKFVVVVGQTAEVVDCRGEQPKIVIRKTLPINSRLFQVVCSDVNGFTLFVCRSSLFFTFVRKVVLDMPCDSRLLDVRWNDARSAYVYAFVSNGTVFVSEMKAERPESQPAPQPSTSRQSAETVEAAPLADRTDGHAAPASRGRANRGTSATANPPPCAPDAEAKMGRGRKRKLLRKAGCFDNACLISCVVLFVRDFPEPQVVCCEFRSG